MRCSTDLSGLFSVVTTADPQRVRRQAQLEALLAVCMATLARSSAFFAILFALAALSGSPEVLADDESFEKRCHQEVVALHTMIEEWLAGKRRNTDEAFRRFSAAMADDFEIISPSGIRQDREAIVASFRRAHDARGNAFAITIKNIRTRLLAPPLAMLTYEEWQSVDGMITARLSSVLLRDDPVAPGGVAWVHLQETWLPGLSPASN